MKYSLELCEHDSLTANSPNNYWTTKQESPSIIILLAPRLCANLKHMINASYSASLLEQLKPSLKAIAMSSLYGSDITTPTPRP